MAEAKIKHFEHFSFDYCRLFVHQNQIIMTKTDIARKVTQEFMFFIAGIPLFLLPVIWKFLPESLTFIVKENKQDQARPIVARLAPDLKITEDTTFELYQVGVPEAANVVSLFKRGRAVNTLLFWLAFFTCLLTMYALSSWLPKLMMAAGYSMDNSLMFMMVMNVGAVVGIVTGDRKSVV